MKKKKNKKKKRSDSTNGELDILESDEFFYCIAGYTSNGVPYGISWEQAKEDGLIDCEELEDDAEDIPF
ncbi:hypothetical protein [Bacillus massilinigeriensis]|uniref:hypothetical protein n=1 Tax=Bacillus mediterraneensis TaxID=1805474 RepID=UPI0008F90AA3|nr:hypothetical protein [Bacillus mediterraneensis]